MCSIASTENVSILKAIDGSHLKWTDFRRDVLLPFGISIADGRLLDQLPAALLALLQDRLPNLPEASQAGDSWRAQVSCGQSFGANSTIFPPDLLPPISQLSKLQRCLSPKMSREGLPRRTRVTQDSLFELPHAKPLLASSFLLEAFSDSEHRALSNAVLPTGTFIDFDHGRVVAGRTMACPFLAFEFCPGNKEDDIELTLNMCALSGAQCAKGLRDTLKIHEPPETISENAFAFSCAINDDVAVINSHVADDKGHYTMSALCRFDLDKNDHFQIFQTWIEAIEEWAVNKLLPNLKASLAKSSNAKNTPPVSPMPSLTLSIDILKGSMPALLRALRNTYPSIEWQSDEVVETPIMSSMAACGTPWEGRRLQSLALGPMSPAGRSSSLIARRRHNSGSVLPSISTRRPVPYTPTRPSPLSPRYIASPELDWDSQSPCRPSTLSPCTPGPDMPWTAQAPMLVLRKRVDVAMDEIQELRRQMEALQHELEAKTKLLNEQAALATVTTLEHKLRNASEESTPVARIANIIDDLPPTVRKVRLRKLYYLAACLCLLLVAVVIRWYHRQFWQAHRQPLFENHRQNTTIMLSLPATDEQCTIFGSQFSKLWKLLESVGTGKATE